MNWVDYAILGLITASTLLGLFWGLIRQIISIGGLVGGIYMAGRFYQPVADFLHGPDGTGLVADPNWARIIGFASVVILFSLLLGAIGSALRFVLNLLFLGWLDHLLGGLLGFLVSTLLSSALIIAATVFPVPGLSDAIRDSQVAQWLGGFTPAVLAFLPPEFQAFRSMMGWGP